MAFNAKKPCVIKTVDEPVETVNSSDEDDYDFGSDSSDDDSSDENSDTGIVIREKESQSTSQNISKNNGVKTKSSTAENELSSDSDEDTTQSDLDNSNPGIEMKTDSESEEMNPGDEKDPLVVNAGWADSVAKILGTNKPKNKKTLVLSKAKKHSDVVKKEKEEKVLFQVVGDDGTVKQEVKEEVKKYKEEVAEPTRKRKIEKPTWRVKPDTIKDKDHEKALRDIATRGVVQLFNAIRNHQKSMENQLDNPSLTEGKKEKILKKIDKRTFLDTLMGGTSTDRKVKPKDEVKTEETPKWSALRDDFMMGAKLKDWDKEPEET